MAVKNDERQFEADIEELMTTELGWEGNSVSISTSSFVL